MWVSGDAYEPYVGRWSRQVAVRFVDWLAIGPKKQWLDVGCGTGALTTAILDRCEPESILGIDPSEGYVASSAQHIGDARARFEVGDARNLATAAADVVVSGLVLNFLPNPAVALGAMRAAAPAGVVAAYVWDYAGRMDLIRYFWDAAVALDTRATDLDEGARFPICRPELLETLWRDTGFIDVQTRAIDVRTAFRDFDDYWSPFLGGQGPAPGYAMSLDDEHRNALRDRIHATLPTASDGSINLIARAWSVKGRAA